MHYRRDGFDRMPVIHWGQWLETHERWIAEGLPADIERGKEHDYFNAVRHWASVSCEVNLYPGFEQRIVEATDEYLLAWGTDGVLKKDWKGKSSIPHFIDWSFKSAEDWPRFKEQLQIDAARIPEDLDTRIAKAEASGLPIVISTGSMMGWVRNWMGLQNMVYLMFDSPECYADIVDTISDLVCWAIDQIVPRMSTTPDMGHGWEDIAGSTGPFVSPGLFDALVAPGYRKIRAKLEEHGIHIYSVDSDGDVRPLIANWFAAGVNMMFPLEPGTWRCTPEAVRAKHGKEMLIQGGFDKLVLERGREAIDAEMESHLELMKEGGFVMMTDHIITPGVPLDDYKYYLERIRELRF